jgi:hypothetical protein
VESILDDDRHRDPVARSLAPANTGSIWQLPVGGWRRYSTISGQFFFMSSQGTLVSPTWRGSPCPPDDDPNV